MNAIVRSLNFLLGRRPPSLQVGAICLDPGTGRVLLITSRGTGRWVIPKGWPMAGKSLAGAAACEAWEEAGVEGRAVETEIGRFRYDKAHDGGFVVPIEVVVFPLYVEALKHDFPEAAERECKWFLPADAANAVDEPGLKKILRGLPAKLGSR